MNIKYEVIKSYDNYGPSVVEQMLDFFIHLYEEQNCDMEEKLYEV